ncbi:MAG: GTP cyclohydrolase II [Caldilineales bacterium]|nr:GTP cyclohydrolase II [Caldilineales bacterium]MCX7852136.1 GTP cyclohydrolase II [Caldilineales bacterium]
MPATDQPYRRLIRTRMPTHVGLFYLYLYAGGSDGKEHMAFVHGDVADAEDVLVRVHSECFTGDVLGSLRCDCGEQLRQAIAMIAAAGRGVLIYLRQEGRGIGLLDKLRAYNLQDEGYDTIEANLLLGHQADERDYEMAAFILRDLGVRSIRLLTNNPHKMEGLQNLGIVITARVPMPVSVTAENLRYLRTKALRMNHLLPLTGIADDDKVGMSNGTPQSSASSL